MDPLRTRIIALGERMRNLLANLGGLLAMLAECAAGLLALDVVFRVIEFLIQL
jgi:hypothetical protein